MWGEHSAPCGTGDRLVAVMVRLPETGSVKVVDVCGRDDGGMGVTRAPASPLIDAVDVAVPDDADEEGADVGKGDRG